MPKVVLIGTEPHMLSLLRGRFEQEGFEVASVAEEGWRQQVSNFPPDLIVLGKRLDEADLGALGGKVEGVPIIMLTASGEEQELVSVSDASQEVAQLKMPFRPSQLLELARKTIAPA